MDLKAFLARIINWLRANSVLGVYYDEPQLDNRGLLSADIESGTGPSGNQNGKNDRVIVKAIQPVSKSESLEKLQEGFNQLVGQLENINEHLSHQIAQHEILVSRMDKLPELLEHFPAVVENQKQLTEELVEQLKATASRNEQFIDVVEKIPREAVKQTDCLNGITHQLAAAADADALMAESFNKFNETLGKLNQSTMGQTESITQMNKTFTASDRYLKYLISRQNKRFMWIFVGAMSICVLVILVLTGIIIYLKQ